MDGMFLLVYDTFILPNFLLGFVDERKKESLADSWILTSNQDMSNINLTLKVECVIGMVLIDSKIERLYSAAIM